jgi:head-tail adaptor
LRAGLLRDRVSLERIVDPDAVDTRGEPTPTWSVIAANLPARVRLVSAREADRLGQLGGRADWAIELRDPRTVTVKETDRLTFAGRTLNITGVITTGLKREDLVVYATEATSGAAV